MYSDAKKTAPSSPPNAAALFKKLPPLPPKTCVGMIRAIVECNCVSFFSLSKDSWETVVKYRIQTTAFAWVLKGRICMAVVDRSSSFTVPLIKMQQRQRQQQRRSVGGLNDVEDVQQQQQQQHHHQNVGSGGGGGTRHQRHHVRAPLPDYGVVGPGGGGGAAAPAAAAGSSGAPPRRSWAAGAAGADAAWFGVQALRLVKMAQTKTI